MSQALQHIRTNVSTKVILVLSRSFRPIGSYLSLLPTAWASTGSPRSAPATRDAPMTYASKVRKPKDVLWPPNPKAFDTATSTVRSWGTLNV